MENDLAGLDSRILANYITQAWVGYTVKDAVVNDMFANTTFRVGSILTAGGQYLPAAYLGITVLPPINPFGAYGYGVQIQTDIVPGVTFTGDVTGTTGKRFNDLNARTSRFETSQRITWDAVQQKNGKTELQLQLTNAWSDEFHKIALGAVLLPTDDLGLYGAIFRDSEHEDEKKPYTNVGGYVITDYRIWRMEGNKLDLHSHVKVEKVMGNMDYTGYTGGLSLTLPEDGGYGRIGGSNVTFDVTKQSMSINNGPVVNDTVTGVNVRVFF